MAKILFRNALLADVEQGRLWQGELLVDGGTIAELAPRIESEDAVVVDLGGAVLSPGFIDLHVHLREPGLEYKETIATGTRAAAAGGFTTVLCMPNTKPPLDRVNYISWVIKEAANKGAVRVLPIAAITEGQAGQQVTDFSALKEAGAVAFSDDGVGVNSTALMLSALRAGAKLNVPIMVHEEDVALIGGSINAGKMSEQLGDPGLPAAAEYIMLARDLYLAELASAHLHVCHVSAAESVDLLRRAKARGIRVTAEVTPHHLLLTEDIVPELLGQAKVNPPLRTETDRLALIAAVRDGTIDTIATDHAPHAQYEKEKPLAEAAFGFSGLETAFPVAQAALVGEDFALIKLLQALTIRPAEVMDLPQGRLAVGAPADLVVLAPEEQWTVRADGLHSLGKNTPFLGEKLKGRVLMTMVNGEIVYRTESEEDGYGRSF